jgi:hypothetical protein
MSLVKSHADLRPASVSTARKPVRRDGGYHEALAKAGVLLDGSGLQPSSKGWRIRYSGDKRTILDGPFAEAKELVAGYTMIQTKTREEVLEWARRFPNPSLDHGEAEIEVRQLFELEDFAPNPQLKRFEAIKELNS